MKEWKDFTKKEKIGIILNAIVVLFCAFAIAGLIKEFMLSDAQASKETGAASEEEIFASVPIDVTTFEEYKLLSKLFENSGDVHVTVDLSFLVASDVQNGNSEKDYPTDGSEFEDQRNPNEVSLSGDIWKNDSLGIYKNYAELYVFGKMDQTGIAYDAGTGKMASLKNGEYVPIEFFSAFTSPVLSVREEELKLLARNATIKEDKLYVNIPVDLFLKITGTEDFGLISEVTDKTVLIPIVISFHDGEPVRMAMTKTKDIPFSEGILQSFFLTMDVLGKAGQFEMPSLEEVETTLFEIHENTEEFKDVIGTVSQITVTEIPHYDRLITSIYGEFPMKMPSGEDFSDHFQDGPQAPVEIWNVAAYITYEESLESFEKWYLNLDLWEMNTLEVKKACVLLSELGIVNNFRDVLPEGEYDSILERLEEK